MNRILFVPACLLAIALSGCESDSATNSTATVSAPASEYVLATRPETATSLSEAAETITEPQPMVLVGRIDAGDFPAFEEGQATFMLSELPADGHGADDPDHEDNCPFCKRRAAKAPKAIVNLVDQDGQTLKSDARQLLGVKQGDRVIAVGTASFDKALNAITLQCNGVYTGPW